MKVGKAGTAFLLGSLGSLLLAGCGGSGSSYSGGGGTPPPAATVTSVAVSCASATVNVGQTSQCSATVQGTGSYSSAVNWSVNSVAGGNATVGTVSTSGLYTAPSLVPNTGTVTVSATSSADSSKSATAALKIKLSISVSPQNATIELFHPQQFTSTITGVTNTNVTWAINGVAGGNQNIFGQITAAGLYTPPVSLPSPASITVTATSQADTTQSASATAALITDTTALSVTSVSPASNATSVSVQTPVTITFNEAVDPSTINTGSISLSEGTTHVPVQYSYDATANTVTLTPLVLLDPQAACTITVGTQMHDLGGNPLATAYTSSFTIEASLSVTGTLTPPSGIDPASLTVLSLQGQQSPADSNGNFSASTSPVGTTLISAMFSAEASGLMAIAISDTSTNPTSSARPGIPTTATSASMEVNPFLPAAATKPLVQIRTHQITASTAKASSTNGVVLDFQTTAEAVLFLSPALFRNDPQGATTIMTAIAADPNTQALASALSLAWNESHPLQDTNVSVAYTTALSSILTTLIQQSGSATPSVATSTSGSERVTSNHANSSAAQATASVTLPVYDGTQFDVCCVSVNPFTISGSGFTSTASVTGFTFSNPLGNAAGWAMRVVPLAPSFNPGTLQPVNGDSVNPDSPGPVTGENTPDTTIAQEIPMPPVSWIPGNSILQYGDIYGDVNKLASWVTGLFSVQNPIPNPQPNITLPQTQPAFYLVRYFSGGTADSNEIPLVANSYNPSSPLTGGIYDQQLWGGALIANYATAIANVVLVGQASDVATCLAGGIINDGTVEQSVLNISPGTSTNWNGFQQVASTILSGLANNLPQCFVNAGEQQAFAMTLDAAGLSSGVGEIVDGISGASEVGTAAQMMAELFAKDRPFDTAYIQVPAPPHSSAASVAISPSTLALTVGGNAILTATAYDSSQNAIPNASFTWNSSNQQVAEVPGSGSSITVTGLLTGTATITATTPNGAQAIANVTVTGAQVQNLLAPTLFGPANGATGVSATPTFSWSAVVGSDGYRLLVATSAATLPSSPSVGSCGSCIVDAAISGTSYTPSSALRGGVPYYWEVHALTPVSNPGFGAWSSTSSFTITAVSQMAPQIVVVAGGGSTIPSTTPEPATSANLNSPDGVAVDKAGNLYIAGGAYWLIEKVSASTGQIVVVAGGGNTAPSTTPIPATSAAIEPNGVAVDGSGNLYIADAGGGYSGDTIDKINTSTGEEVVVAGGNNNTAPSTTPIPATSAYLFGPYGVAVDGLGNIYIADGNLVDKVYASTGEIVAVAGGGSTHPSTTPIAATSANISAYGVAVDGLGNIYIADGSGVVDKVYASTGQIVVVAGGGSTVPSTTPESATSAKLNFSSDGVAVDGAGNLYIADSGQIEKVDTAGQIVVVAGSGSTVPTTTPITAISASIVPMSVAVDRTGNLYIGDWTHNSGTMNYGYALIEKVIMH